ncbi:hypothetical protein BCR33DRAFT_736562 [Rhizoclosmatium globosum]|uniref:Uncharacterized protein n=1 Tax=Rhizoclosmatium globosum TaxID=329046 RepID=A0A1Y2CH11_9FUNG|nr:hypothetical protein BCR33DRAFT_736562 [Rhizoclosmatium globosum]|eukprot:ORY46341.1 hypothetical protein BCR33DRAFT_736562 [Rhizoclosmatium globosum]
MFAPLLLVAAVASASTYKQTAAQIGAYQNSIGITSCDVLLKTVVDLPTFVQACPALINGCPAATTATTTTAAASAAPSATGAAKGRRDFANSNLGSSGKDLVSAYVNNVCAAVVSFQDALAKGVVNTNGTAYTGDDASTLANVAKSIALPAGTTFDVTVLSKSFVTFPVTLVPGQSLLTKSPVLSQSADVVVGKASASGKKVSLSKTLVVDANAVSSIVISDPVFGFLAGPSVSQTPYIVFHLDVTGTVFSITYFNAIDGSDAGLVSILYSVQAARRRRQAAAQTFNLVLGSAPVTTVGTAATTTATTTAAAATTTAAAATTTAAPVTVTTAAVAPASATTTTTSINIKVGSAASVAFSAVAAAAMVLLL